jgi:hypothetical protein
LLLAQLVDKERLAALVSATAIVGLILFFGWVRRLVSTGSLLCGHPRGYTPAAAYRAWEASGPGGPVRYRTFLVADAVFVPLYSATLAIALAYSGRALFGIAPADLWIGNAALLAGCADWAEDGLLGYAVWRLPRPADRAISAASVATITKWSFLIPSALLAFFGIVATCVRGALA